MSWWKWNNIPARIFATVPDDNLGEVLIFASDFTLEHPSSIYEFGLAAGDRAFPIHGSWQTPDFDFGEPGVIKRFSKVTLDVEDYAGGTMVTWCVDGGTFAGQFEANWRSDYRCGDDVVNIDRLYNDSAGTQVNGMYCDAAKATPLTFNLPKAARGKVIRLKFDPVGGINGASVWWEPVQQLYPSREG